MSVSKRWCFTLNNYDADDEASIQDWTVNYLVYGREVGDSGTPHLQGFATFKKATRLSGVRKLHDKAHWEPAKGNSIQASDYCKKDGDYFEKGQVPSQGKRTDLEKAVDTLKQHGVQGVAEEHPTLFLRYSRGFRDLALALEKPYTHTQTRGIWIWGPPGSGKSHAARGFSDNLYLKAQNKWFDGYAGERVILLDDLDTDVLGHYLKIWSDKYACTGETKGGTIHLRHTMFIVTSNYPPSHFWPLDPMMLEAINRRFKIIHKQSRNELIDNLIHE